MLEHSTSSALEAFVLLANGAKGAAAVTLVQQVLEASGVYVFGELLDHPNIGALEKTDLGDGYFRLLNIFAYGTFGDYLAQASNLPPLTDSMKKKLRLLTIASMATKAKLLKYSDLQKELDVSSVRELEDLIIEGTNSNVVKGKLDQKASHFEVDFAMGRDVRKSEIGEISRTLQNWFEGCDEMLACLQDQAMRANAIKASNYEHKVFIEKKISEVRGQLRAQQQHGECSIDDPDSRMDTDRREKKVAKGKAGGLRGSSKGGFWQK